jgi:hypothetical protein
LFVQLPDLNAVALGDVEAMGVGLSQRMRFPQLIVFDGDMGGKQVFDGLGEEGME